jgi:hypothetical protein
MDVSVLVFSVTCEASKYIITMNIKLFHRYTHQKLSLMCHVQNASTMEVPGLVEDMDDMRQYNKILDSVRCKIHLKRSLSYDYPVPDFTFLLLQTPGMRYEYGFNEEVGDSVIFKTKAPPTVLGQRNVAAR